jgi:hypothetical protein
MPLPDPWLRKHAKGIQTLLVAAQRSSQRPVRDWVSLVHATISTDAARPKTCSMETARRKWAAWRSGHETPAYLDQVAGVLAQADRRGWLGDLPASQRILLDELLAMGRQRGMPEAAAAPVTAAKPFRGTEAEFAEIVMRFRALIDAAAKEPRSPRRSRDQVKHDLLIALREGT